MSELDILIWIDGNMSSPVLDLASKAADALAGSVAMYCLALLLLVPRGTRRLGILLFASMLLCDLLFDEVLKAVTARERPFAVYPAELIIPAPSNYSFPSGHTENAFILAFSVLTCDRRFGAVAAVFAAFVAFSRLYLFVHWPTDVLAGVFFAALSVYAVRLLMGKLSAGTG